MKNKFWFLLLLLFFFCYVFCAQQPEWLRASAISRAEVWVHQKQPIKIVLWSKSIVVYFSGNYADLKIEEVAICARIKSGQVVGLEYFEIPEQAECALKKFKNSTQPSIKFLKEVRGKVVAKQRREI